MYTLQIDTSLTQMTNTPYRQRRTSPQAIEVIQDVKRFNVFAQNIDIRGYTKTKSTNLYTNIAKKGKRQGFTLCKALSNNI